MSFTEIKLTSIFGAALLSGFGFVNELQIGVARL